MQRPLKMMLIEGVPQRTSAHVYWEAENCGRLPKRIISPVLQDKPRSIGLGGDPVQVKNNASMSVLDFWVREYPTTLFLTRRYSPPRPINASTIDRPIPPHRSIKAEPHHANRISTTRTYMIMDLGINIPDIPRKTFVRLSFANPSSPYSALLSSGLYNSLYQSNNPFNELTYRVIPPRTCIMLHFFSRSQLGSSGIVKYHALQTPVATNSTHIDLYGYPPCASYTQLSVVG
ncbi:hypothetical protein F5887DRAFT_917851 [Amanita rubescens]|nr:hypothetical protein F5887DRAFT_917851 [Amanita rubescens]